MGPIPTRATLVVLLFAAINTAGWVYARRALEPLSHRPRTRIVAALPARDVDRAAHLTFLFDEPIAGPERIGALLDPAPFTIAPAVDGEWRVMTPVEIDFVLRAPLAAGRIYTVRASAGFEAATGRALEGADERQFRTRPLSLTACEVASADRTHATIALTFDQPVAPADLARCLRVDSMGGEGRLAATVLEREPARELTIRVPRPRSGRVCVRLSADLRGAGADLPLETAEARELSLEPVFTLLRAETEGRSLSRDAEARLRFSSELDPRQTPPRVELTPAVDPLRVRVSGHDLVLEGPFVREIAYRAGVGADVLALDGRTLGERSTVAFELPGRRPEIEIPLRRGILMPSGNLSLDVRAVNVPGVTLEATRVYASNLAALLHGHYWNETSRIVTQTAVRLSLPRDVPQTLALDLAPLVGRRPGVYSVDVATTGDTWARAHADVSITDLAITTKRERGEVIAWVTSLSAGRPVGGALVRALSYQGQPLATARTDADGLARLPCPDSHQDGAPWLVTAEMGDDLAYLELGERVWSLDGVDVSGRPTPAGYDVMLYCDRGVYRPGEALHVTGICRDASGAVPPAMPLSVEVRRPDGRLTATLPVRVDDAAQGMFHVDVATAETAPTGPWKLTATLPGGGDSLGEVTALVEAFEPVRIEVKADPARPRFGPGETPAALVRARYLFDAPASGLAARLSGTLSPAKFAAPAFPGFTFDTPDKAAHPGIEHEATLDEEGKATIEAPLPDGLGAGAWRVDGAVTVTEDGGRSTSHAVSLAIDTASRHLGLRVPPGSIVPAGEAFPLEWTSVDPDGAPLDASDLALIVERVEQTWRVEEVRGRLVWRTEERRIPAISRALATATPTATGREDLTLDEPGRYEISISDGASGVHARAQVWVPTSWESRDAAPDGRPERIELVLDRPSYAPGALAHLLVRSPFAGSLLLSVETDRVIETRSVELTGREASLEIRVDPALRGSAFIAASVVRAVDPTQTTWRPHRAAGLVRLRIDPATRTLPLSIDALRAARPGDTIAVTVRSATSTADALAPQHAPMLHLWAVDEGILLATAQRVPDPVAHFHGVRRCDVATSDVFPDLLPDLARPASMGHIGGDSAEGDRAARRNPLPARHRAPAIVWRTAVPLGPDGTTTTAIVMPDLIGAMRIMAVVVDGDRYASAERTIALSRPLMAEASMPRALAPGDHFLMPIKIIAMEGPTATAEVRLTIDGPAQIESGDVAHVVAATGKPGVAWFSVVTTGLGQLHARVDARAGAFEATCIIESTVRPAAPIASRSRAISIAAGESLTLDPDDGFLPGSAKATLSLGGAPTVDLRAALDQVVDFPHGCVEQTTSRALAMLRLPELLVIDGSDDARRREVASLVQAGVDRLSLFETRSGGLSYWPDGGEPNLHGTLYATAFLLEARRAGYVVEGRLLDAIAGWLEHRLSVTDEDALDGSARAETARVLAALDRPPLGWLARLSEAPDSLGRAGRAHLAAAWLSAGRKDRAMEAIALDTDATLGRAAAPGKASRPWWVSDVRADSALLDVLLDLSPEDARVALLVQRLEAARRGGRWGGTLENASAISVLAKFQAASHTPGTFEGEVRIEGRDPISFSSARPLTIALARGGGPVTIASRGAGTVHVAITAQGLDATGKVPLVDRGIRVRRVWTDREGKEIGPTTAHSPLPSSASRSSTSPGGGGAASSSASSERGDPSHRSVQLRVGDVVHVTVTIDAPGLAYDETIDDVAIVDLLPGGLEIENHRLATSASAPGEEDSDPERVQLEDDRAVIFTSVGARVRTFHYTLRASAAGSFTLPPMDASSMYDEDVSSLADAGHVEVSR